MQIIGDSKRFAVEYELNENHGGVWLFGKVCFRIGGERVGNFELGTSLRDFLFQLGENRWAHGHRKNNRLASIPANDVVELLDRGLFIGGDDVIEQTALDEQWARHKIDPEVDVFDGWRIYLVESDTKARLLWCRIEPGAHIHDFLLAPGECDKVLEQTFMEIDALYEAERAKAGE